jgi:hypothetical protein
MRQKTDILTQKLLATILNMGKYSVREHHCLHLKNYTTQHIARIEPHIKDFCNK